MGLHQFYKDHYFYEANRRHQLTGALVLPSGIVTFLIGAVAVLIRELTVPFDLLEKVQVGLAILAGISIAATVTFLFRSYYNYTYRYIATPKVIKEHLSALTKYHVSQGRPESDAEAELIEYIGDRYAESAHTNTDANDRKSGYLHKANGCLIASVVYSNP